MTTLQRDMILVVIGENGQVCETTSDPLLRPLIQSAGGAEPTSESLIESDADARSVVIDIDEDGIIDDSALIDGCTLVVLDLGLIGLRLADGWPAADAAQLAACPKGAPEPVAERIAFWASEIAAGHEPRSW